MASDRKTPTCASCIHFAPQGGTGMCLAWSSPEGTKYGHLSPSMAMDPEATVQARMTVSENFSCKAHDRGQRRR